jgi:hypothetical protein
MSNSKVRSNSIPTSIKKSKEDWVYTVLKFLQTSEKALKLGAICSLVEKDDKTMSRVLGCLRESNVVIEKRGGYKLAKNVTEQDILVHSNLIQQ